MKVAFGLKSHSGWAALVVLGTRDGAWELCDRRRLDLVAEPTSWRSKQPYHTAAELESDAARALVAREIAASREIAERELRAAVTRARDARQHVAACAVLVGTPMPDWSVDEILAVHFRMHKAEGALFEDALLRAADACGLSVAAIPEKQLSERTQRRWGASASRRVEQIAALGRSMGAPWGKDQKAAALAAAIALEAEA